MIKPIRYGSISNSIFLPYKCKNFEKKVVIFKYKHMPLIQKEYEEYKRNIPDPEYSTEQIKSKASRFAVKRNLINRLLFLSFIGTQVCKWTSLSFVSHGGFEILKSVPTSFFFSLLLNFLHPYLYLAFSRYGRCHEDHA